MKGIPIRSTLSTSGGMAAAQVILAVGYSIAARAAGPAEFGQSLSAIAIGAAAAGLLDFGLTALQTRELASGRSSSSDVAAKLVDRLIVGALIALAANVVNLLLPVPSPVVLAASAVALGTLGVQFVQVPLRASGRMHLVALATVTDKLAFGLVVVALISVGVGGAMAVVLGVLAGLLTDVCCCLIALGPRHLRRVFGIGRRGRPRRWMRGWRGASGYGLAGLVSSLQPLDVPLMSVAGGPLAAGVYGAVSRWTTPLLLPASAIAQVGVAHAAAAGSTRAALASLRRVAWIVGAAAVASVAIAIFAKPLTVLVLGVAYEGSSDALRVLALATIPTLLAQPLVMIVESRKRERSVALALLASLLVRLGTVWVFAPSLGGVAGAVAVLAQQTLTFIFVARTAANLLRVEGRVAVA